MAKNQDFPLGLKWYKFYTSFYLPVFSFFSGLALFGDISALFVQKSYSYYPLSELYTFVFFGLIFELITFCFQIAALIRLRRDDEKSFATNNAYLIFLCIFSAYKAALFQVRFNKYSSFSDRVVIDTSSVIPAFIITFLLVFFVWFLPNFYYFKKRLDYLCGTYIRPPSQDILSMFDEIKENPQAIKEKARELHSAGKVDLYEYQYIIECYIDNAKPAMQDEPLYKQPKSYEDVVSMCDLLGNNIEGKKDVLSKALSSGAISSEQYVGLKAKYIQGMTDVEIPDVTTASSSQKETQTAETLEDRPAPSQTARNQEQKPTVKSETKEDTKTESQFDKDVDAHPVLSYILLGFGPILWLVAVGMLFAKGNAALGAMLLIVVPIIVVLWFNRNKLKSKTTGQSAWKQTPVFRSEQDAPCCKHCGAKLIEGASFCNKCGQKTD